MDSFKLDNMHKKNQLAFFSANLHQYLPEIPWQDHTTLFQYHQRLHLARTRPVGKVQGILCRLKPGTSAQPGLLAAFHLGAHTELALSLAHSGVEFDILIDRQVHHRYQDMFRQTDRALIRTGRAPTGFYYSDDPRLFFQVRSSLRSGRHVLIYVDGNGGMDTKGKSTAYLNISFFSGTLWLRQGIALLARMLQAPIYPILNAQDEDQCLIKVLPPIWPDGALSKEEDARRIVGLLYGELENWLQSSGLMYWECWKYLHYNGMLRLKSPTCTSRTVLPSPLPEYVVSLVHPIGHFWMDKSRYTIHYNDNILQYSLC